MTVTTWTTLITFNKLGILITILHFIYCMLYIFHICCTGYIAGVFCAIVSHPADTIVSKLNQDKGSNFVQAAKNLGLAGECYIFVCQDII